MRLTGSVSDPAFRAIAGAQVAIVEGPQAGASTTTDSSGLFSFTGTFDDSTRIRASRDGYVSATEALVPSCATCNPNNRYTYFYLSLAAAPVSVAGEYTLTFVADSTCAGIPEEVRTRTYTASISPSTNPRAPAGTMFDVAVGGAAFRGDAAVIPLGVAGNLVAFEMRGHGEPTLVDELGPTTYLTFDGRAEALADGAVVSTLSTSFEGSIGFCDLKVKAPAGPSFVCAASLAIARVDCASSNHQLIMRRR
jgi:hypothetical protein